MKKRSLFILSPIVIIVGLALFYYFDARNFYEAGEGDHFEIRKGETFTIRLDENATTGLGQCWVNEKRCGSVKLKEKSYKSGWMADRYEGSGAKLTLTFIGTAPGLDTIKMCNCPVYSEDKKCEDFENVSSIADNHFIVKVSE